MALDGGPWRDVAEEVASVQVILRLRLLIGGLLARAAGAGRKALEHHLAILGAVATRAFPHEQDRRAADVADLAGLDIGTPRGVG